MTRHAHRRRHAGGYALIEIIFALALITVTATLGTRLAVETMNVGFDAARTQRDTRATDAAVAALRHDVERASQLGRDDTGFVVGRASWGLTEESKLVRVDGTTQSRQTFDGIDGRAELAAEDGGGVTLRIGDARWTFRPIVENPKVQARP